MTLYSLDGITPDCRDALWIAPDASLIGRVSLAKDSSVWWQAVLRGDNEPISVGEGSNVQDFAMLHTDIGFPLDIGREVTVGHHVTLHGCTIGDRALIGIGATVLNGATIGPNCLVGAGALVTEGKSFPEGSLIVGAPAKAVRQLDAHQIDGLRLSAQYYIENARRYRGGLKEAGPAVR
ncbi:MAG: gamma carbonic anhydrase family protein [Rhodospirillaceae bacterium]|nr:gamma carbonic anhydrase family protein [Rhodospirillaceae bacterium]MCY4065591.1 gamma carbonic anhydrase family protein [Rhodospirillaceae bacterium]MXW93032.1 gamma carbonic anhydrase family protein [Rhodospirillaceae bacterium]MYB13487.1 gamma carbonic anhydrase family protein [Rhodospirillaceae bacterium]MYI49889.1 gamma carbonic anhydrase family protein [Rhodospirillaceae bacterium]